MTPRTLGPAGAVLCLVAALVLPSFGAPTPARVAKPKSATRATAPPPGRASRPPAQYIDGVPDTGQFLPDTAVLGRVENRVFRVRDFRDAWFGSYAEFRPKPDSAGRVEFLNSMVNKEILALTALEVNKPLGFEDRITLREHSQRVLSNIVFQRLVADSARPTEAELRDAYAQRSVQLRLQHVQFADRALAERVRQDLVAGRISWPVAVKKYSQAKADKGPDGELGWLVRSAFDPSVALDLYSLRPGQYSKVFEDRDGFHVARVAERRQVPPPPFESVRTLLLNELAPAKMAARVEQIRSRLRARIGLQYDTTNIVWASQLFGHTSAVRYDESGRPTFDVTGRMPEFAAADTSRLLARWKDGRFTLGSFLREYQEIPVPQRQDVNSFDAFRSAIDGFVLEPHMAQLATERGLDRDSLALALIAKKREQLLVEHLFRDSVESKVWISPQERQQYYQARQSEFVSWRRVRYAALVRGSKGAADSLRDRLAAARKPGEAEALVASILRADSARGDVSGSVQERTENERGPYFKVLFEELRPGQATIIGPDKEGDYLVLQLFQRDPGRQLKYEEVQSIVDESLQNQKSEALLNALIDRHRNAYRIEQHPERVMRIRLVDPMLD